jgi:hypothetical protein
MTESRYEYLGSRPHQALVGRHARTPLERALTHRNALMRLLPGRAGEGRRGMICVLGAGQCHDLDLENLLARFHEIHLVDRDEQALRAGCDQQGVRGHGRIRLHGNIDIAGIDQLLNDYARNRDAGRIARLPETPLPASLGELGQFEVVVSANLLPEIMLETVKGLGIENRDTPRVLAAVRQAHIETLLEMTRSGGQAFLVTELTTSRLVPELASAPHDLDSIVRAPEIVSRLNPGCNHGVIDRLLLDSESITSRLERYDMSPPWLRQEDGYAAAYIAYRLTRKL